MSVNVRSHITTTHGIDPFLYTSKGDSLFDDSRVTAWNCFNSYPSFDGSSNFSGDQFCPTSSPSSPASTAAENLNLFYSYDQDEPCCLVKEEPFEEQFEDPYLILLREELSGGGLPNLDSLSEDFCDIPPQLPNTDTELEARYADFMQILGGESINQATGQFCPVTAFSSFMDTAAAMDVAESDSTPSGSISSAGQKRSSPRLGAKATGSRGRKPVKKNGSTAETPDFSGVYEKLSSFKGGDLVRRSVVSPSQSITTTTSNSDEDVSSPSGQHKQSKRSSKSGSPEAYTRRREKNNIAVRKSREKKRQEIKKFADEHTKLKREVDQIRAENEKLRNLVTIVEDGIVGEKSRVELETLIKTAKKQLRWC